MKMSMIDSVDYIEDLLREEAEEMAKLPNLKSADIEIAIARYLDYRKNLIVPNVWWGLGFNHELDLLVVTGSGFAWEIEIKISVADMKKDLKKRHCHKSNRIRRLYFCCPIEISEKIKELLPESAGLLVVDKSGKVQLLKAPIQNTKARKLTEAEISKVKHLGCMRIWELKKSIQLFKRNQS